MLSVFMLFYGFTDNITESIALFVKEFFNLLAD